MMKKKGWNVTSSSYPEIDQITKLLHESIAQKKEADLADTSNQPGRRNTNTQPTHPEREHTEGVKRHRYNQI